MAINESVYGDKNLWYNAFFQQSALTNKNKIPYFDENKSTLIDGVTANKLSFSDPIDKSISYCGLGAESALSHIAYTNFVNDNVEITDIQDRSVTNFGFFEKSNTTQYTPNASAFYYDNINWIKWGDYENLQNYQRLLSPLTLINPHNVVLAINVSAYDSNMSDRVTTSLYNYIHYNTSTHPNIDRVTIQPFYGDISLTSQRDIYGGKGNVTYGIPFQLSILDEYQIPSKNVNFYSYGLDGFPVFGNIQNLPYTYNNTNTFGMVLHTEKSLPHIKIVRGTNDISYVYTEYYPEFEQDIIKTVACFGLYFSPIVSIAREGSLTDNDMYIGLLDENGIGHGQYFRGSDTARAPQAAADYTDMSNAGYTPSTSHIDYDNTPHYGTASYESINKMYALTGQQVLQVMSELSNAMSAIPSGMSESDYSTGTFLTNNPIDCIVSLRKYPIYNTAKNTSETYPVMFGGYESQIRAPYAKNVQVFRFDFTGSKAFISNFGDSFLDREPYTTAELYIPFCGTVKLSCDEFINHAIGVRLILDYRTGSALAYIERDGIPQMSIGGDMGVDIPLTGVQTQTLANTIRRNIANLKQAQISAVQAAGGGATMSAGDNPLQLIGGMINIANRIGNVNKALLSNEVASYSLHHTEIPFKSISTGDAVTGMSGEWCCRLAITRPILSPDFDPETYGKTIGYACLKQGRVSDFTGLTVGTIDLTGINAPAEVKTMIQAAFKQGVYL